MKTIASRSGPRHSWLVLPSRRQPQFDRQRSTPCAQLHAEAPSISKRPRARMIGEVFRAIRHDDAFALGEIRKGAREFGRAGLLMMAEGFAVGRDHHGRARRLRERRVGQPIRQLAPIGQQIAEGDLSRELTIEAKDRETQVTAPPFEWTGLARRDAFIRNKAALMRRQDRIFDSARAPAPRATPRQRRIRAATYPPAAGRSDRRNPRYPS